MRKIILIIYLLTEAMIAHTQPSENPRAAAIVVVANANYQDSIAANYIYTAVARTLIQTKRFTILDVAEWKKIIIEKERQKDKDFIHSAIVENGYSLGAKVLVIGRVNNTSIYCKKKRYGIRVDYELKFIDVATDTLITIVSFKCDGKGFYDEYITTSGEESIALPGESRRKIHYRQDDTISAMSESVKNSIRGLMIDAIESTTGNINSWVRSKFDFDLLFLKVLQHKKKRIKSVLIEGGKDIGMKNGSDLKIVALSEFKTPTGTIQDKEIVATLKVKEIRAQTSMCTIIKIFSPVMNDTTQHPRFRVEF